MSENNKRYVYFVSYMAFDNFNKTYFPRNREIVLHYQIQYIDDIRFIEKDLNDVNVTNFQLLRTEDI